MKTSNSSSTRKGDSIDAPSAITYASVEKARSPPAWSAEMSAIVAASSQQPAAVLQAARRLSGLSACKSEAEQGGVPESALASRVVVLESLLSAAFGCTCATDTNNRGHSQYAGVN